MLSVVFLKKLKCYLLDLLLCWFPLWVYPYLYKSVDGGFPQVLWANWVFSIRQKSLIWICKKIFQCRMEQRFPESLEKRTTSQSFPKFWSLYNFPRGLSKMFECLSFRNFNKFRSYRKLFQEIFVSPTPVSKVQKKFFFCLEQSFKSTTCKIQHSSAH